jgi:hypothetical protein
MGDDITHSSNFFLGNGGMLFSKVFGESFGGFADDADAAQNCILFFNVGC